MSPIIVRHGASGGSLDQFLPGLIAGQRQKLDEERFRAIQDQAERRFMLESEAAKRAQEAFDLEKQDRQAAIASQIQARQARQQAAGLYADQIGTPPMTGNIGEDAIRARKLAATQSAVRALAAVDPEQAQKFLAFLEKEMQAEGVRSALTGVGSTIGKRLTEGSYFARGMDGNPIEDPTYAERAKQRLQRLEAASKLDPAQAVNEVQQIAQEDQADTDEIKARTALNLSKGRKALKAKELLVGAAQSGVPEDRIDRAESIIVNLETGDYDKDLKSFSEDFDQAIRGLVTVNVGGAKIPVDEAWLRQYQTVQMQKAEAQAQADAALTEQRKATAAYTGQRARGLELPRNGANPLQAEKDISQIMGREFPADVTLDEAGEKKKGERRKQLELKAGGGSPEERLIAEINAGKLTTPEQVEKRAKELGAKLKR